MPSEICLVNRSKKEYISFYGLPASKGHEVVSNKVCCALISKYMLVNMGNEISLINSGWGEWPFSNGNIEEMKSYNEVTNNYIKLLAEDDIIKYVKTTDEEGLLEYDVTFI